MILKKMFRDDFLLVLEMGCGDASVCFSDGASLAGNGGVCEGEHSGDAEEGVATGSLGLEFSALDFSLLFSSDFV